MNRRDVDVLIVGAGPVGLMLANLLGRRGQPCLAIEKHIAAPEGSRAIGITPPSLGILGLLGLDRTLVANGVRITRAHVHDDRREIGRLDFDGLPDTHPFILSIPQSRVLQILAESAQRYACVRVRRGVELVGIAERDGAVQCTLRDRQADREETLTAGIVAGCDGHDSATRRALGIECDRKDYGLHFVMGDTDRVNGLGEEAHLYFTRRGSVEAFPLPERRRRWIALAPGASEPEEEVLKEQVLHIAGYDLRGVRAYRHSSFRPVRLLARRFVQGRAVLCGDAAHVMSPIGGQGMNTGFADAEFLAAILPETLDAARRRTRLFGAYETYRRRAFRVAARRAAVGMWIGTRRGQPASLARSLLLGGILLQPPVRRRLAPLFAMLTIPHNRFERVD